MGGCDLEPSCWMYDPIGRVHTLHATPAARTFIIVFHVVSADTSDGEAFGIVGMLHVMDVADVPGFAHFAGLVRRAEIFH